jgi:hypothetical protein
MSACFSGTWLLDTRTRRYVWAPGAHPRGMGVRRQHCNEKTAAAVAALCRRGGMDPVEPFLCQFCKLWHVGKRKHGG